MNIKALLATSVVAVAPFAFAGKAEAKLSDCWFGTETDEELDHFHCDVSLFEKEDGTEYFEVTIESSKTRSTMEVTLWTQNRLPDGADLSYSSTNGSYWDKTNVPYKIDSDGDVNIDFGNANLVFRFPDHKHAGTGCVGNSCGGGGRVPVSSAATPTDGLQRGDLSDTPFRF